jgi:hypothetical protein
MAVEMEDSFRLSVEDAQESLVILPRDRFQTRGIGEEVIVVGREDQSARLLKLSDRLQGSRIARTAARAACACPQLQGSGVVRVVPTSTS